MLPLQFPPGVTIAMNFALWFLIHYTAGYLGAKLPAHRFARDGGFFRTLPWEQDGTIYQRLFKVKKWKGRLPDAGNAFGQNARKHRLAASDPVYLEKFILETRRAEWTHWIQIFPVPVFFLFNDWKVGIFMIFYALCVNLPCMMIQRYNRPRLQRILNSKRTREKTSPRF
jgi:glycosyl-4,4'-diaponeurosporenoate acyltransferase